MVVSTHLPIAAEALLGAGQCDHRLKENNSGTDQSLTYVLSVRVHSFLQFLVRIQHCEHPIWGRKAQEQELRRTLKCQRMVESWRSPPTPRSPNIKDRNAIHNCDVWGRGVDLRAVSKAGAMSATSLPETRELSGLAVGSGRVQACGVSGDTALCVCDVAGKEEQTLTSKRPPRPARGA